MVTSERTQHAGGVATVDRPLRFFGIEVGARMTVLDTPHGQLVHSPVDVSPEAFPDARWVLAPNKLHHLFIGQWAQGDVEAWAAPGLPEKRTDVGFHGVVTSGTHPFGPGIEVMALSCFDVTNEVVVFHEASRTLVVTDLLFHFPSDAPWLTRAAMRCACAYPGCQASVLERVGMRRPVAREELGHILGWDFDRLIMAHGRVIETGGKDAFRSAYRWLGL